MSNFTQASDDIKQLASRFKNLAGLAEKLESIGSVENAATEADARKVKAYADAEAAEAKVQAALQELLMAQKAIGEAGAARDDVVHAAEQRAEAIVADAQAKAKAVDAAIADAKAKANAELKEISAAAASKNDEMQEAAKDLAALRSQIDELKSKLSGFAKL